MWDIHQRVVLELRKRWYKVRLRRNDKDNRVERNRKKEPVDRTTLSSSCRRKLRPVWFQWTPFKIVLLRQDFVVRGSKTKSLSPYLGVCRHKISEGSTKVKRRTQFLETISERTQVDVLVLGSSKILKRKEQTSSLSGRQVGWLLQPNLRSWGRVCGQFVCLLVQRESSTKRKAT